jgi:hypothetical protein
MTATLMMSADAQALRFSLDPMNVSHFSSDPLDLAHFALDSGPFATAFSFEDEDDHEKDDAKK